MLCSCGLASACSAEGTEEDTCHIPASGLGKYSIKVGSRGSGTRVAKGRRSLE